RPKPPRAALINPHARARQLTHPLDDVGVRRRQPRPKHLATSPIDRRRDNRTRVHIQTNAPTLAKHRGLLPHLSERPSTKPHSVTHEIARARRRPATTPLREQSPHTV